MRGSLLAVSTHGFMVYLFRAPFQAEKMYEGAAEHVEGGETRFATKVRAVSVL